MSLNLDDLISKKNFSELSSEEKQFVLTVLTESDYTDYRTVLINSKKSFQNDFLNLGLPNINKKELSRAFNEKFNAQKKKPLFFQRSIYYKLLKPSLYIGIIVIIFFLSPIKNMLNSNNNKDQISYILNENTSLLKINTDHSSELINGNLIPIDSIIEMNNYLRIKTEGLDVN